MWLCLLHVPTCGDPKQNKAVEKQTRRSRQKTGNRLKLSVLDFLALNVNLYWNIIRIPEIIVSSNSSEIPLLMISCLNKTSQSNLTLTDLDL